MWESYQLLSAATVVLVNRKCKIKRMYNFSDFTDENRIKDSCEPLEYIEEIITKTGKSSSVFRNRHKDLQAILGYD